MEFFGISIWEFLLILIVIVVVLGPAKIPGIARNIGNLMRTLRKASSDLSTTLGKELEAESAKKTTGESKPADKPPEPESRPPDDQPHHHD